MEVAEFLAGRADFDTERLVAELVAEQSVPHLSALRFKPSGQRKRSVWERVWSQQRLEDEIDARSELPDSHPDYLSRVQAEREKHAHCRRDPEAAEVHSGRFPQSLLDFAWQVGHSTRAIHQLSALRARVRSFFGRSVGAVE